MSKIQSDRQEDIQFARQTDKVTERQNDSMADSRAAKEPALVSYAFHKSEKKISILFTSQKFFFQYFSQVRKKYFNAFQYYFSWLDFFPILI